MVTGCDDAVTADQFADTQRLAREWDAAHPREPEAVTSRRYLACPSFVGGIPRPRVHM